MRHLLLSMVQQSFVTLLMSLLSVLVNLLHSCWIKVLISSEKKKKLSDSKLSSENIVHKSNGPLLWYFYDALLVFLELDSPHSLSLCGKESTLRFPKTSRFMFLTRKKVIVWTGMMVSKQWQNVHFSVNCSFKNVARIFSSLFVLVILSLFVLSHLSLLDELE